MVVYIFGMRGMKLRKWQEEAIVAVDNANKQAIVEASTGAGKTTFAIEYMKRNRMSTLIVCPTIVLCKQWKKEIIEQLQINEDNVGLYYGKLKQIRPITIGCINSLRDLELSIWNMWILDECHKYASPENLKPFLNADVKIKIAMTATLKRSDERHKLIIEHIGPVVYTYSTQKALKDDVLNAFKLINVSTSLTFEEQKEYDTQDKIAKKAMKDCGGYSFMVKLLGKTSKAINTRVSSLKWTAINGMKAITRRRMIYCNAKKKTGLVLDILKNHPEDRVIIFSEFIESAEAVYEVVKEKYNAGIYHSKTKDIDIVNKFSQGEMQVLVSVKSLNEGLDVKSANVGIELSGNSVKRSSIQKLGRVIRKQEGKQAFFYRLYCRGTKEYNEVIKQTNLLGECASDIEWRY